jgi:hypothetical protein
LVEEDGQEWQLEVIRDSVWQFFHIPLSAFGGGEEFLDTPVITFKLVPVGGGTFGLSSEVADWIDHVVLADSVVDDFDDGDYNDWNLMIATNGSYLNIEADSATVDGSLRCLSLVHGNSLQGGFLGWIEKSYGGLVLSPDDSISFWLRGISYLVSDVPNAVPAGEGVFELFQNYPNPFNGISNFQFRLPSAASVSLKIYDLLGREVATLLDGELDAGSHNVLWDASDQASGVYAYQLRTGSAVRTKLLVLMR